MKLKDFSPEIAQVVIDLWEEHLGFYGDNRFYMDSAEFLSSSVKDPENWPGGRFEPRMGSRYTDDSKFLVSFIGGDLQIECYVQAHTVFGKEKQREAEKAEESFNKAVKDYIKELK